MSTFTTFPLEKIDRMLNKWAPILFSIFKGGIRKDFDFGRHCTVKTDFTQHLYCTTSKGFSNSDTDSFDNESFSRINDLTLILDCSDKDEAKLYYKKNRHNPLSWVRLQFIDESRFKISQQSNHWEERPIANTPIVAPTFDTRKIPYPWEDRTQLECFRKCSLVALEKKWFAGNKEFKSKGGKKGLKVELEFDNPYGYAIDVKDSIMDAYRIAVTYGFNKIYRNFYRKLMSGEVIHLEHPTKATWVECRLLTASVNNYKSNNTSIVVDKSKEENASFIVVDKNVKLTTMETSSFIVVDKKSKVDIPERAAEVTMPDCSLPSYEQTTDNKLYVEWQHHCKSLNNDPERCWTFEEYIEIAKGA